MKEVSISGSPRVNVGKKDAKVLRREGNVPCVIYGGKEQVCFFAHENSFSKLVYSPDVFKVNIDVNGSKYQAVMQDIQFHPITDKISHIDFLEVLPGKPVVLNIPVSTKGSANGVKEGGRLSQKVRTIKAKGLIEKMPELIELDVTELNIGDSIRVKDLKFDGVTFMEVPNLTVVAVNVTRNVVEEAPAAAATPAAGAAAPAAGAPAAEAAKKEGK